MESVRYKFIFTLISGRYKINYWFIWQSQKKKCGNYYYYYHYCTLSDYAPANNFVFVFIYLGKSSGDENGARWVLFQCQKNIIFQWFAYQCFTDLFERVVPFNKVLQTL